MDNKKISADELRVILDYYSNHPPPWIDKFDSAPKKKKMEDEDIKIVENVLRSLSLAAEHFRSLWNWSEFANCYLHHSDTYVVWLACQCMAIILQLTESEKNSLINSHMDQKTSIKHMLFYYSKSNLSHEDYLKLYREDDQYITVEGVPLPIVGCPKKDNDFILVNSTKQNLKNLSLAISTGKVACLVGPVGSGKTSLIQYLANITGHADEKLLTVQLGDETDSKMMLGSYHCTEIPGEFVWQPGALTKAVTEGKWLLLEDIDSASSDLAAVLVSLVESRSLAVPGFRDQIVPALGFQLFLTQRIITTTSGYYQKQNIAIDLLGKHFIQINVEPLNKNELIEVIEIKFPILKTITPRVIDVFLLFSAGFHNSDVLLNLKSNERLTSTRDLMKWCERIIKKYDVTSSDSALKVIQDAIDIFCCSTGDFKTRLELARHITSLIGIVKTKAEYFLTEYKPTIKLDEKYCVAGRVTLLRNGSFLSENYTFNSKFALTRSSSCLIERIACCIAAQESVLLVGETGTGKTSTLQLLAKHTGNRLIVLNMNQQSDSVDLIGGYKPVELKIIIKPIRDEFERLFRLDFNIEQNTKFLGHISTCFNNREWSNLIKLIKHVIEKAIKKNIRNNKSNELWLELNERLTRFEVQFKHCQTTMAFSFVEGSLIKAVKEGYWVLLDEINLASAETLQCLSSLLESNGTVTIYEKSDSKPISRHPNFRLMAAMNPATDIGKKDLPPGIRNRFTEFFVDELTERSDLITLTACYLPNYTAQKLNAISKFYLIAKHEAEQCLVDGTGHKPHYSLRTYCRALSIASLNPCQSAQRSLYESFCLSFLTQLDSSSHKRIESLIATTMFAEKLIQGVLNQPILRPKSKTQCFVQFEGYWIQKGNLEPLTAENYILTDSVKKNLRDIVRAVSLSSFPVLIQGDTCVGKTSLITFLAAASGNTLVRINNHEHTDLQEYIGSYSAESITGQLIFNEGVLVQAMRKGHWIVLDELNLAPSDVLEALNRVLDDNRELFIPETQTIVKANPGFRLFATQNPPGLYGGRKILSRAFKNRFIEMHFDEIPANELETILFKRCKMPLSYAKKVVSVMKELQSIRKGSAAFAGKHGFITLRDLFRWGERYRLANAPDNYNWDQHLIDEGFLVLASKVRKREEEQTILQILEKHFKCSLSLDKLFTLNEHTSPVTRHILEKIQNPPFGFEHVYMSKNIRRMIVLSCKAMEFNEPILLVGETGVGKTTICQMISAISKKKLLTVNCHQHTESSDFIGGLRPVRNRNQTNDQRLFEWVDGPLITALIGGHMFLADEISLADDSVLERFNSLLEPERKLLLSEKIDNDSELELVAHPEFCFISTMNPGGDYGKKELSPALRNRLTEIWCETCSDNDDLIEIVNHNFIIFRDHSLFLSRSMVDFVNWLKTTEHIKNYLKLNISIRDYLIWVKFIESMMSHLSTDDSYHNSLRAFITFFKEGAMMTFLGNKTKTDSLYDNAIESALNESLIKNYPKEILDKDDDMVLGEKLDDFFPSKCPTKWFGYNGYYIPRGNLPNKLEEIEFDFNAPTTKQNLIKLLRCMQIENRAILLEGSPGVGKTGLIKAVSEASGHKLTRINLSEQTDVSDLFGADLPIDGGDSACFEWRDGPFLRALKEGNWILLDELNLASQSVLEGLNAVLDHRGELYIPELGRSFIIKSKETRLFACQNPMSEGGSRKGLPKSFLNRFLQVYLNVLECSDIVSIIHKIYDTYEVHSFNVEKVINFTFDLCNKYNVDLNLRDILRWINVTIKFDCNILNHLPLIFNDGNDDFIEIQNEILDKMEDKLNGKFQAYNFLKIFPSAVMFNRIIVPRKHAISMPIDYNNNKLILKSHIYTLNLLAVCMEMNWMPIVVGSGSGKTSVIKTLAQICGIELRILSVNSAMDTIEILGGFEQADFNRHLEELARKIESAIFIEVGQQLINGQNDYILLLTLWNEYKQMTGTSSNTVTTTMASETALFKKRIVTLIKITNALKDVDLSNTLRNLEERVCITGNLNSGGKFEWIDSTLVKCLKDGCWLLIDNVNLCSPAVLDRLNGLLEPNGVLELGEKGIDSDGQITVIKPHKDFRLFLAMDPKHGSISRAMKNRGVEVYMDPLEEIDDCDIHSMLELQGIQDQTIRHILIEIHIIMKKLNTVFTISINQLLRSAYLVSQHIKYGQSILQIVRDICFDTYIRCLSGNVKKNAILEIDLILEKHFEISNTFSSPNIKTMDVLQSSSLCYIKQQCYVLEHYKNFCNTTLEDLLLSYFGRSSSSDIEVRSQWLAMQLNCDKEAIIKFIKQTPKLEIDMLCFRDISIKHISPKDLPYDFRYLPNVYYKKLWLKLKTLCFAENKMHLLLDHALNRALDENFVTEKLHKKRLMMTNDGILHDFSILSIVFDDLVDYFINDSSLTVNESDCFLFKEMVIWTRTIEKMLFNKLDNDSEFITVLIHCYFKIIIKHFIPTMESITMGQKNDYLEQLKTMKNQISKNYLTQAHYAKFIKLFMRKINLPLHQCCKDHNDKNVIAYRRNNDLSTAVKSNNIQTLTLLEMKNERNDLLQFGYNNCNLKTIDNKVLKMKKMNDMELKLIPLWELIIERNLLTHINYTNHKKKIDSIRNYAFIKSVLQFVPTVSPFYCHSLKTNDKFPVESLIEALKHSMTSVAVETPKVYLKWPYNKNETEIQDVNEEMQYSFEQPLFTVFITDILLKKNEPFYTFAPRPIRFLDNTTHNLLSIKSFIYNSPKWTSDLHAKNIKTLVKMVETIFSPLLPKQISCLEELDITKNNPKYHKIVATAVNNHKIMVNAIYDTAKEMSDIQTNLSHLKRLERDSNNISLNDLNKRIQFSAGRLWVLSGMCLLEVFSGLETVDPLQKMKVRIECAEVEKKKLKSRAIAEQLLCTAEGVSDIFPFKDYYIQRFKLLSNKKKNIGYRSDPKLYNILLKEIVQFTKMYGLDSNTYKIINSSCTNYETLVNEMENWLSSVTNFYNNLNARYAEYPDILSGVLLPINMMRYGMRMLKNHYKWTTFEDENLEHEEENIEDIEENIEDIDENIEDIDENIEDIEENFEDVEDITYIEENITNKEEELLTLFGEFPRFCPNIKDMINVDEIISMDISDKFRWYKLCLEELNNLLYLSGQSYKIDQYKSTIEHVLNKFVHSWKRLQEEEERKKSEEDNLYKQKSVCEVLPLDVEIAQGIARQFPNTKYADFNDIEGPNTLDCDISQKSQIEEIYNLNDKDVNDICQLHTELIRPGAIAHWLTLLPVEFNQNEAINKLKNSFSDRFCMFGKQLMSKFMYLHFSMDSKMLPWLLLATDIANNPKQHDNKGYYDFYRDSNIESARKTYEVLKGVEVQIQQLLNEWPDHPTLQTIMKIVDRIMNFDSSSPTCRFLIGLELLLTKLHEWEEVAHRGISVNELSLSITNYIQEYRNLELNTWKDCLKTSQKKFQNDSSKWWFHLYSVFQSYLHKEENFQHLVTAIQKFMESSTLGQFEARLDLLYTFHCDIVCRETNKEQTELCYASWNLYRYYSQFKEGINLRIETLSKDIKRKLHDFIKIVKWNDINYWSVKETVTKIQQNIHKYTREYTDILNNSASFDMITDTSIQNTKADPYHLPILKLENYLKTSEVSVNIEFSETVKVLSNLNKYSKKVFTFFDKIMNNCLYLPNIIELNDYINDIMKSAQELRDLNVDLSASKSKQKSQAKQIMQQKRKALSELFKSLQQIGLSYKAGLIGCEQIDCSIEFSRMPPLDINAALKYLIPKLVDNDLLNAWSDCEPYFLKSISQTVALNVASQTPKLGLQEMDRIKGFINDLKNITWNTKKNLAFHIDSLVKFRSMIYLSDIIPDSKNIIFDPSEDFQPPTDYIMNCINILQQFKIAIQCCAANMDATSNDSITYLIYLNLSDCIENKKVSTSDDIINNIDETINMTQKALDSIVNKKTYQAMKLCDINFIDYEKYNAAVDVCDKLFKYIDNLYKKVWTNENSTIDKHRFEYQYFDPSNIEPQLEPINSLINQVLISVEKLYKKYSNIQTENEDIKLLKCLVQPLSSDLNDCDLTSINKEFKNVLKSSIDNNLLKSCIPLFEQYALLVQYYITQQTMVYRVLSKMNYLLSSLFTDLTSNGFCVPDELLESEDIQSDGKSGMGLTEGEGTKDVSDQIESQDQLEDAKKDYNDQPEPDKDITEEKNGIEMSDDFDGKLHDLDKEETENSDNENDDFDQDKEMGETGEGAETLDEKLWGSDSDDENGDEQENPDLKEEDGKGGESMGDKQLEAKNENENIEEQNNEELIQKNSQKDINMMDDDGENVGEDHTDSHHGELEPPPEPEPMNLPNNLQLDEGEVNENDECEENPFDIDTMKENTENTEVDESSNEDPKTDINNLEDSSNEEEDGNEVDDSNINNNDELENEETKDDLNNDGGKKDDNKTGEDPKEENKSNIETAKPSEDKPSQIETQPSNFDNGGSKDQVCDKTDKESNIENIENNKEEPIGPEQQGVGQSQGESKETEGHCVDEDKGAQSSENGTKDKKRRMKPGEKNINRTLAESTGPLKKRLKTTNIQDENVEDKDDEGINDNEATNQKQGELYKHVKDSNKGDTETLDAATNEQLEKRPILDTENEISDELKENDEIELEEDVDENETQKGENILPEKIKPKTQNNKLSSNEFDNLKEDENCDEEPTIVDGEIILTLTAERGIETMFHTIDVKEDDAHSVDKKNYKEYIQNQFDNWLENEHKEFQKDETWNKCIEKTSNLAQELSEQLRLVLEPSKASRLQGDFRTGRRINMRRVIPYIASHFKKDKIWLRRTRPSKRQYQIIMAVDNSSSMLDSDAKSLAFESLALVSKALALIEAGELGVMSFGEQARIIHPLGEPFADQTGLRLINDFTFNEQKTKVGELIELATAVFEERGRLDTSGRPAQLLILISDGRGIKCEGPDYVKNAIRTAKLNGIFIVFIVIDNPTSKESILDIKIPIFENNAVRIESYMDNFPFPYYVILRDVSKLPGVLSDALREWFELVTL